MRCANTSCNSYLRNPLAVKGDICSYCKDEYKERESDITAHDRVIKEIGLPIVRLKTVPTDMYLDIYTQWELRRGNYGV